jgi:hypothetical protein
MALPFLRNQASHEAKAFYRKRKFHISLERSMNAVAILATNLGGGGAGGAAALVEAVKVSRGE